MKKLARELTRICANSIVFAGMLFLGGCATPGLYQVAPPTVVFLSDFGTKDDSVALCKGVMWDVAPQLRIVDLTHEAPPYDVRAAGRLIAGTAPYYPKGTVFVAVVDPGVGSTRKPIAALSKQGKLFVGPDNGLFHAVLEAEGLLEAREIANRQYWRKEQSHTFHGRDIFAPAAAYLADHAPFEEIGPLVTALAPGPAAAKARLDGQTLSGSVDFIEEPYGNVITDVPAALVAQAGYAPGSSAMSVSIGAGAAVRSLTMPFAHTFSDVKPGERVALISSRGFLTFAVNQGHFAREQGGKPGDTVKVDRSR